MALSAAAFRKGFLSRPLGFEQYVPEVAVLHNLYRLNECIAVHARQVREHSPTRHTKKDAAQLWILRKYLRDYILDACFCSDAGSLIDVGIYRGMPHGFAGFTVQQINCDAMFIIGIDIVFPCH